MKTSLLLGFPLTILCLHYAPAQTTPGAVPVRATYTNPLPVQFGDPYVLFTHGTYYMYGTGGRADKGFAAYSSNDLVN